MKKTVHINGIMCAHCEMRVKKALEALSFINSAVVSHETGTAVIDVSGPCNEESIRNAVSEAGYTFVSID